jgi:hypothetical protein
VSVSAKCAAIVTLFFWATSPAHAWGSKGHRLVARVAEAHLTDSAREAIQELLGRDEDMADASTYPDEHKKELKGSAPWHYVNVPLSAEAYSEEYCDAKKGCVVEKIKEFRGVLKDKSKSEEDRLMALRYVIHFVGDVHQPLHVGDNKDRGGNGVQVRFFNKGTNLHKVWDTDMIEHFNHDEDAWLKSLMELDTAANRRAYMKGTPENWATESLQAAKEAYQLPGEGRMVKKGDKLGDDYYETNLPVVKQRLYQAGVRLAWVLNDIFE